MSARARLWPACAQRPASHILHGGGLLGDVGGLLLGDAVGRVARCEAENHGVLLPDQTHTKQVGALATLSRAPGLGRPECVKWLHVTAALSIGVMCGNIVTR